MNNFSKDTVFCPICQHAADKTETLNGWDEPCMVFDSEDTSDLYDMAWHYECISGHSFYVSEDLVKSLQGESE